MMRKRQHSHRINSCPHDPIATLSKGGISYRAGRPDLKHGSRPWVGTVKIRREGAFDQFIFVDDSDALSKSSLWGAELQPSRAQKTVLLELSSLTLNFLVKDFDRASGRVTSEAKASDDIGIGESMGVMTDEVLAATFAVVPEVIRAISDVKKRAVISKRAAASPT